MKRLVVCGRDANCEWAHVFDAGDPRALDAQAKHHAVHDRRAAAVAERRRQVEARATEREAVRHAATLAVRAERGRGSAAPAPRTFSCACCELGLFGNHGVGHVMAVRA